MQDDRRKFTREAPETRREALVLAALDLMATGGEAAATTRAIAGRAGVSAGMIRHHFATKTDLTRAAFAALMARMTGESRAMLASAPPDPVARLAVFVAASLSAPVVDAARFGLWATFIAQVAHDPGLRTVHRDSYLAYRDTLQSLIAALPDRPDAARARGLAIACNGVIDGLWIEGCAASDLFAPGELAAIGLRSVGALVGHDLHAIHEKLIARHG